MERGFSVNKEINDTNMAERTLVARRMIVDSVRSAGGVENVEITSKLLMFAASAYHRYSQHLKDQKEKSIQQSKNLKRKAADEELECLRKKITCLERDIASLAAAADDYALKAETQRDISLIVRSNRKRKTADEKREKKRDIEKELSLKVEEVKNMA